jgi:hypothetical protein
MDLASANCASRYNYVGVDKLPIGMKVNSGTVKRMTVAPRFPSFAWSRPEAARSKEINAWG